MLSHSCLKNRKILKYNFDEYNNQQSNTGRYLKKTVRESMRELLEEVEWGCGAYFLDGVYAASL